MANEYTSIATGGGIAVELVQDVYDLAVAYALRSLPTSRVVVTKRPVDPAMRGKSIILEKVEWFGSAAVTAAKTPLGEESDVDSTKLPTPSKVQLTPNEYGFAVTTTKKLTNRTFAPLDPIRAQLIADHQNRVIDSLVQDTMKAGTNKEWGGGRTANVQLTSADKLTAAMIRRNVARLRAAAVPTFTGGFYLGLFHPFTILDLREETGAGSWRTPKEYLDKDDLRTGEIGEFEGVRFVQNNLIQWATDGSGTGGSQIKSVQGYIVGQHALAEQVVVEPHVVVGPTTDKLGRFHTVGWYGDVAWGIYEQKALRQLITATSLNADLV